MKKVKLIIAAIAMLGLVSSSAVYADGFAPGEGLYVGLFGGHGMGIVQPKVTTTGNTDATEVGVNDNWSIHEGGTWEANDGGLGLSGMEYGGWMGYGYKMGSLYAGLEGEMAASDVKFKVSGTTIEFTDGVTINEVNAEKEWVGGAFGRLGYYVNNDTLLSLRGGVLVSKFKVTSLGSTTFTEDYYGGGPAFGVSLTSRLADIDPNLSVRIGATYTDFLTAAVSGLGDNIAHRASSTEDTSGSDSEVTGDALSAQIGVTYSFFDANSLF